MSFAQWLRQQTTSNEMTELPSIGKTKLYVSQIIDNLSDLAHFFGGDTETIVNYAQRHFKSAHRQYEWLTVRAMLRQVMGTNAGICYDDSGKPQLTGLLSDSHFSNISISHSKTHAALLLADHTGVGVDIELVSPRILRLANRIAQSEELPVAFGEMGEQERSEYLTALWTAKEAIYKSLANQAELEMLTDIRVKPFDISFLPATACTMNGQKVFLQKFQNNFVSVI